MRAAQDGQNITTLCANTTHLISDRPGRGPVCVGNLFSPAPTLGPRKPRISAWEYRVLAATGDRIPRESMLRPTFLFDHVFEPPFGRRDSTHPFGTWVEQEMRASSRFSLEVEALGLLIFLSVRARGWEATGNHIQRSFFEKLRHHPVAFSRHWALYGALRTKGFGTAVWEILMDGAALLVGPATMDRAEPIEADGHSQETTIRTYFLRLSSARICNQLCSLGN